MSRWRCHVAVFAHLLQENNGLAPRIRTLKKNIAPKTSKRRRTRAPVPVTNGGHPGRNRD